MSLSNVMRNHVFKDGLVAYQHSNDPPFVGDWRPTVDYPRGTTLGEITQFEVWDGLRWCDPQEVLEIKAM